MRQIIFIDPFRFLSNACSYPFKVMIFSLHLIMFVFQSLKCYSDETLSLVTQWTLSKDGYESTPS